MRSVGQLCCIFFFELSDAGGVQDTKGMDGGRERERREGGASQREKAAANN
jgi:hypothetical protein